METAAKGSLWPPSLLQLWGVFGQLDGMFCSQNSPRIPGSGFKREGGRRRCGVEGEGETPEVKCGAGGLQACPSPLLPARWPGCGAGVRPRLLGEGQGPGWRQQWCQRFGQAYVVKSGPGDSLGWAPESTLRTLKSRDTDTFTILQIGQLGSSGSGTCPGGQHAGSRAGREPGLSLPRKSHVTLSRRRTPRQ